jgi:hypothetical protein
MDERIFLGGSVKALGHGKVGGHLVLYGSPETPDLSSYKDYFTESTEYDIEPGERRGMYWSHGLDPKIGVKKIGTITITPDEVGLWAEGVLNMADDYERHIYALAEKGKLGWSSGAPAHLVARKAIETKSGETVHELTHWPIAEGSLTPTPADYRNQAYSLKSLAAMLTDDAPASDDVADPEPAAAEVTEAASDGDDAAASDATPTVPMSGKQADVTALKEMLRDSMTFGDHSDVATSAMEGFVARAEGLAETSIKSGRVISAANRARLAKVHGDMRDAHAAMGGHMARLATLLTETDPDAKKESEDFAALRTRFVRLQSDLLHLTG